MVVIISNDSVPFQLEKPAALLIQLLKPKEDRLDSLVTRVDIDSTILKKVILFCDHYSQYSYTSDEKWQVEYFENDAVLTKKILSAAHGLDIPLLVEASCKAIAGFLHNMTANQMRQLLDLDDEVNNKYSSSAVGKK